MATDNITPPNNTSSNPPNENDKYYEKFTAAVNYLIVYAQAASINLNVNCTYPESFMVAYLSTGEHDVTLALSHYKVDLKAMLDRFKTALQAYSGPIVSYHDLTISKQVWDIIKSANQTASDAQHNYIGLEHVFIGMINVFKPLQDALKEEKVNVADLVTDLINGKFKSASVAPKTKTTEVLESLCTNITNLARSGKLDPIIARDDEIEQAITILCRRHKRNPLLVGQAGVGKTAIIDGIAQRIVSNTVPDRLKDCKIYGLHMSDLVAGTKYRGEFETRIQSLIRELENDPKTILFIDELHTIVGAGSAGGGSLDAANILKPALARGMRCIGATTHHDYKKHIYGDGALERRFETITVEEPNIEQMVRILTGIKYRYEEYHNCIIPPETVGTTVCLAHRYLTNSYFPDKAIDCLDTACAKYSWTSGASKAIITPQDIMAVISKKSKMPIAVLSMDNVASLELAKKQLAERVTGQDVALTHIGRVLKRTRKHLLLGLLSKQT